MLSKSKALRPQLLGGFLSLDPDECVKGQGKTKAADSCSHLELFRLLGLCEKGVVL